MTSEASKIQWLADNTAKVKSVLGAVALYIGGIEAAHPTQSFWEVFTSGGEQGYTGALTIAAGILGAAIAAWRTDSTQPSKFSQKRDAKLDQKVAASLNRLNGNGDH